MAESEPTTKTACHEFFSVFFLTPKQKKLREEGFVVKKGKCAECAPHCLRCDTNGPEVLSAFFFGIFFGLGPSHPDKDNLSLRT